MKTSGVKAMKYIVISIVLILLGAGLFGQDADVLTVTQVIGSSTTGAGTPAGYAVDENPLTGWGLAAEAADGWIELRLNAKALISGMEIEGILFEDAGISIEYDKSSRWMPFYSGYVNGLSGNIDYISLVWDNVVTDRVRIRVSSNSPGYTLLKEIRVIGKAATEIFHRIDPLHIEGSSNTSGFFPVKNLVDGNTYTVWKTKKSPFPASVFNWLSEIEWYRNRFINSVKNNFEKDAEVEFTLPYLTSLEKLRVFLGPDTQGDVRVDALAEGTWQQMWSIPSGSITGWYETDVGSLGIQAETVRIVMKGNSQVIGGLGEVEIWGTGKYAGDTHEALTYEPEAIETSKILQFFATGNEKYKLEFLFEGTITDNFNMILNGREMNLAGTVTTSSNTYYSQEIERDWLFNGINFLKIEPFNSPPNLLNARLTIINRDGNETPELFKDTFLVGTSITGNEMTIDLDEEVMLQQVSIDTRDICDVALSFFDGYQWIDIASNTTGKYGIDFSISGKTKQMRITVTGENTITRIKILGSKVSDHSPIVKILWPKDGDDIPLIQMTLGFVIGFVDNPDTTVTINDITANQRGHYFWLAANRLSLHKDNPNTLNAIATDTQGRTGSDTIVIYSGETPGFQLDQPDETIYTDEPSIEISGRVSWPQTEVKVNGEVVTLSNHRFSKMVNLEEGFNLITVTCVSQNNGFSHTAFRKVVRCASDVTLIITSPDNETYIREDNVYVSGTVSGMGTIVVTVNGNSAGVNGLSFSYGPLSLAEGVNHIAVEATDSRGKKAAKELVIYQDSVAPIVSDIIPIGGSILTSADVEVSCIITEASPVWVYANDVLCQYVDGRYSAVLSLPDATQEITIRAEDITGNTASETVTITVDTVPPEEFTVIAYPEGWTSNNQPVITFETTDATSGIKHYEVSIDGEPYTNAESSYKLPVLSDDEHDIYVKAIDNAGWETISRTKVFIDTTPPDVPLDFNLIPGNAKIILKWAKPNEDVVSYKIERNVEWSEGIKQIEVLESIDNALTNGETYQYRVLSVDRAGNESAWSEWRSAICGLEVEPYTAGQTAKAEYENVTLYMPEEGLPEGAANIQITEAANEDIAARSFRPIVGPMYDFSITDAAGVDSFTTHEFNNMFLGSIRYDVPEDYDEANLSVWYYDFMWDRWFKVEDSAVDPENDTIWFTTNHFSLYSVQATDSMDLSSEEYRDAGYSPFKSYAVHESLLVSPQGGSVSTSMTELVLPGPSGFDLVLNRRYDLSTAKVDSAINDSEPSGAEVLMNKGDYVYTMGKGWRLDLPYIKNASRAMYLVLPGGSIVSIWSLTKEPGTTATNMILSEHEAMDFTLTLTREADNRYIQYIGMQGFDRPGYKLTGAILTMKNGTTYDFDGEGLCTRITEPTRINSIEISYNPEGTLSQIEDAFGRMVSFEYDSPSSAVYCRYINRITVNGDNFGTDDDGNKIKRIISYTINDKGLLTDATDVGGRQWHYDYEERVMSGAGQPIPVKLQSNYESHVGNNSNNLVPQPIVHTEWLMNEMKGPGKGTIRVAYDNFEFEEHVRIMAHQVYIFNDAAATKLSRMTTYAYEFLNMTTPEYDNIPADEDIYVIQTQEIDGVRETDYTYGIISTPLQKWEERTPGNLTEITGRMGLQTRPTGMVRKDLSKDQMNQTMAVDSIEYDDVKHLDDDGNTVFDEYRLKPWKNISYRGYTRDTVYNGKREITYEYDNWGNATKVTDISEMTVDGIVRHNKVEIDRKYLAITNGPGFDTFDAEDGWKAYGSETGFSLPNASDTQVTKRHDLLLGEMVTNYGIDGVTELNRQFTYFNYNDLGQMMGVAIWDSSRNAGTGGWLTTTYNYNTGTEKHGTLSIKTDPLGNTTTFAYDSAYKYPESMTQNNVIVNGTLQGITMKTGYNSQTGWKEWEMNARGYVAEYDYDLLGRITKITLPVDEDTPDTVPGNFTNRTGHPETCITYFDDMSGLASEIEDPVGRKTRYKYNDLGQLEKIIKYKRDASDNYQEYAITTLSYNRWGEIESIIDPNGNVSGAVESKYKTLFTYDAMGHRLETIYPSEDENNPVVRTEFDYDNNKLTITNELGNVTEQYKDMQGRIIKQMVDDGSDDGIVTYNYYDGVGNLVKATGPRINPNTDQLEEVNYTYNSLNQLVQVTYPAEEFYATADSVASVTSPTKNYEYNENGYLVREILNGDRITDYEVDSLGRIGKITKKVLEDGAERELSEEWFYRDENGNSTEYFDANNTIDGLTDRKSIKYTYSARDQVKVIENQLGNKTTYEFYPDGRVQSVSGPLENVKVDGVKKYDGLDATITYEYDDLGRLKSAEVPKRVNTEINKPKITFEYDPAGNLLRRIEPDKSKAVYEYGPRNLLEQVTLFGFENNAYKEYYHSSYAYDEAGNQVSVTDTRGKTTVKGYDNLNRPNYVQYPEGNTESCTYDKVGNRNSVTNGSNFTTYLEFNLYNKAIKITYPEENEATIRYDKYNNMVRTNNSLNQVRKYTYCSPPARVS